METDTDWQLPMHREDSGFLSTPGGTPSTQTPQSYRRSKDADPYAQDEYADSLNSGGTVDRPRRSRGTEDPCTVARRWREVLIALLAISFVTSLAIIVWLAGASLPPCPKDWMWTNGKCYFFSNKKESWNQSQQFCESHNGNLATILDQTTLDTIRHYKTIDDSWIGLRKRDDVWSWVGGIRFSNSLLPLAQDVSGLHCAYLNNDKYGILHCTSMRNWICTRNSSISMAGF
ncbi:C-type lectin domain family 2 member B-like isoform X2 [Lissotriton helveticus]